LVVTPSLYQLDLQLDQLLAKLALAGDARLDRGTPVAPAALAEPARNLGSTVATTTTSTSERMTLGPAVRLLAVAPVARRTRLEPDRPRAGLEHPTLALLP
jgi:hypothetical protein